MLLLVLASFVSSETLFGSVFDFGSFGNSTDKILADGYAVYPEFTLSFEESALNLLE